MDCTPVALGASIDWLTITNTDPAERSVLLAYGQEITNYSSTLDNKVSPWIWKQYKGEHAEGVSYGEREDSVILQLSGNFADEWFDKVYPYATNCTRIDLAVTVKYQPIVEGIAEDAYRNGCEWKRQRGTGPEYSQLTNSGGGSTCYVGSRISDIYGRVYDKWREQHKPEYTGCWRWEVECKGEVARRLAGTIVPNTARAGAIAATVFRYFARRGCEPNWSVGEDYLPMVHIRPASNVRSRLGWLTSQVRPAVQFLVSRGYETAVIEALGLEISAEERRRLRERDDRMWHNDEGE